MMCKETIVRVCSGLASCDPLKTPVLFIGQQKHLQMLSYAHVAPKIEARVSETIWSAGVKSLQPSPTDSVSLYLNLCTVAALPTKVSRHNTPSRTHSITKIVRAHAVAAKEEYIVVVAERDCVLASVCGVARAYSLYSRKSAVLNSDEKRTVNVELILVDNNTHPLTENDLMVLNEAVEAVRLAARIVDMPANEMTTDAFVQEIEAVGAALEGVTTFCLKGEELRERGMGGLYGVGKAAICPPVLAVLSHTPVGATTSIAWVGKGIVYDTGGLSIKTKTAMPGMKRDCGGAAGILGAFRVAVKAGFTQNLHAVFCLAENAVGPLATKPDDVHTLYSGRSVEINNTDAEGRLVLGDGVVYASKDLHCSTILDMATLTGAQGTATGKYHGAVLSNCELMEVCALKAGRRSGDLLHPLPYTPELHFSEFSSAIADMKNSVADRSNAAPSCAGLFIGAQLGFDFPGKWLHIDMAAPVASGERATGYGVALLPVLFGEYSGSKLLRGLSCPLPPATAVHNNNDNELVNNAINDSSVDVDAAAADLPPEPKKTRLE